MRKATDRGPCARCGKTYGLFWRPIAHTLDFGTGTPLEPYVTDLTAPVLCDECEPYLVTLYGGAT